MPVPGHNEADTRAKLIDPALHQACWVENVSDTERAMHGGLKAVNAKERKVGDTRTPMQLLKAIEIKGLEVDDALARLRVLMAT
jgi:hypothetical protein